MARPTKQGVDYFPIDVQWDEKVELFISETGAAGLGILITIWQLIYQNEGYYANYDDLALLIRRRLMSDLETIEFAIQVALKRCIFDRVFFDKYKILTSKAVQKRYSMFSKKKKEIKIIEEYCFKGVFVGINEVFVGINEVFVDGNATKEKEKEKEKENRNIVDKKSKNVIFVPPSLEQVEQYCTERKNNVDPELFLDYYTSNGWMVGKNKMKDWKASVRTWEKDRGKINRTTKTARPATYKQAKDKEKSEIARLLNAERDFNNQQQGDIGTGQKRTTKALLSLPGGRT